MRILKNTQLKIEIIDPVTDRERLGSRYCHGGYIWQVHDLKLGPLLSGPEYPLANPTPFSGQGLPEVFEITLGQNTVQIGEDVAAIGVGLVTRQSEVKPFHVRDNLFAKSVLDWLIEEFSDRICMTTTQQFGKYSLLLQKTVSIDNRKVTSTTQIKNTGSIDLPIRWFAHPFFPKCKDEVYTKFSVEAFMPENKGFAWNDQKQIVMQQKLDWSKGCFQLLALPFGYPITITQNHPLLSQVLIECNFALAWMPIWANDRTFSFEPYFHTVLAPNQNVEWSIAYGF